MSRIQFISPIIRLFLQSGPVIHDGNFLFQDLLRVIAILSGQSVSSFTDVFDLNDDYKVTKPNSYKSLNQL